MPENNLGSKQLVFVHEYLVDKNATRAAKAAGYSAKTARSAGSRLLTNVNITKAIEIGLKAQVRAAERRAEESGLTRERWLKELARIAFANFDDIATISDGRVEVINTADRESSIGYVIKKASVGRYGPTVELHSKLGALEIIGRAYGWVKDVVEQVGEPPRVVLYLPKNGSEALSVYDEGAP